MHNLGELKIWNKAMKLATSVYQVASGLPNDEKYGLTSQIKRSVVSISSNIAEGAGRNTDGEFLHFLGIANGSCYELQTQLIITEQLNLLDNKTVQELLNEIAELQKMNYKLQQSIRLKNKQESKV